MRKVSVCISLLLCCVAINQSFAQIKPATVPRLPAAADANFFRNLGASPRHMVSTNKMSASTNAVAKQHPERIISVPMFSSSFTFQGQVFPFTMIGRAPQTHRATTIPTSYVPISFVFDEFVDQNGNNVVIDATAINHEILHSPNLTGHHLRQEIPSLPMRYSGLSFSTLSTKKETMTGTTHGIRCLAVRGYLRLCWWKCR